MPSILITGANRGLGLEFTKQFADDGWHVLAASRHPQQATELAELARDRDNVDLHMVDVADIATIQTLARDTAANPVDILLNNAGTIGAPGRSKTGNVDYDDWLRVLNINILGPARMVEAFLPHLEKGQMKRVVNISSRMGSVGEGASGNYYAYRSSKAGLNMAMRAMAADLAERNIHIVNFHPGWVRTAMGGENAHLSPEEAVSAMRKTLAALPPETSDVFLNNDGKPLTW